MEHQTLGRWVIRPSDPANQRIILKIVEFKGLIGSIQHFWVIRNVQLNTVPAHSYETDTLELKLFPLFWHKSKWQKISNCKCEKTLLCGLVTYGMHRPVRKLQVYWFRLNFPPQMAKQFHICRWQKVFHIFAIIKKWLLTVNSTGS